MKVIDQNTWQRRKHFEFFNAFDYPHFSVCANVDVTRLLSYTKLHNRSFTICLVYLITRAANDMPEFRWRIRGNEVIEHDVVHGSSSVMAENNLFSFCTIPYTADFAAFYPGAEKLIAFTSANPTLEDEPGRDDLLFLSGLPWIAFTSITHPIHMHPADSVPRLSWGKFLHANSRVEMPLAIQVSHALMDGYHVGQYYAKLQHYLDSPDTWLI